jgi:MFS family permease
MTGYALGGVAMGRLCDRFGVVVAIMLGTLAVGIGYGGAALVPGPLTFALMHLFIGVGSSATFGPLMADMAQWFVRHRGIAVGLAASGNYIGGALWPPVLQHAIASEGWRHTYLGVGVFCVLATLPFIFATGINHMPTLPMVPIATANPSRRHAAGESTSLNWRSRKSRELPGNEFTTRTSHAPPVSSTLRGSWLPLTNRHACERIHGCSDG